MHLNNLVNNELSNVIKTFLKLVKSSCLSNIGCIVLQLNRTYSSSVAIVHNSASIDNKVFLMTVTYTVTHIYSLHLF